MKIELRDYQKEAIGKMNYKYTNSPGRYLVHLSTGLGKTVIFSNFINFVKGRMLIISHREELVKQPEKYFDCSYGIEKGKYKSNNEKVVSASIQTLHRRLGKFDRDDFEVIIVDEAHHSAAKTYRKVLEYFTPRCVFGFTATPNRGDRVGLHEIYDEMIYSRDLRFGIENNFLSTIECKRVNIGYSLRGVKKYRGDFNEKDLNEAVNIAHANDAIAETYFKIAKGQTLIFGCSVDHCIEIQKRISNSHFISGKTNINERAEIIKDFTDKKFDCLINCMCLTEGTDIPCVETVIIARPTTNTSLYQQMVGRGTRLFEGKDKMLLIDCVGISDIEICSSPSLLGLNLDNMIQDNKEQLEGDLFSLEDKINNLTNNPLSWIKNITTINLWARRNKYDTHGVNYVKHANGDLYFNIPNTKKTIHITKPDEWGNCIITIPDKSNGPDYRYALPIQKCFDNTYKTLCNRYSEYRNIWDTASINRWKHTPATEKQREWIVRILGQDIKGINFDSLTKYEASNILNHLFAVS